MKRLLLEHQFLVAYVDDVTHRQTVRRSKTLAADERAVGAA
jgi:hypothetical protein